MSKSQLKMSIYLQCLSRALILDFHKLSYVTSLQVNRCNLVIANLCGMPHIVTVELTISVLVTSYDVQNTSKNGHTLAYSSRLRQIPASLLYASILQCTLGCILTNYYNMPSFILQSWDTYSCG